MLKLENIWKPFNLGGYWKFWQSFEDFQEIQSSHAGVHDIFHRHFHHRTGLCHGCLGDHGLAGGFHSKSPSHRSGLGDQWLTSGDHPCFPIISHHLGMSENGVYPQWNSHLVGIMISKTIGCRGTNHFQTNPFPIISHHFPPLPRQSPIWALRHLSGRVLRDV